MADRFYAAPNYNEVTNIIGGGAGAAGALATIGILITNIIGLRQVRTYTYLESVGSVKLD
jgi:hypothetical protein